MEAARGAAVGPFCCGAAVCRACAFYSDAEDRAFRSHQRLLHALEQGDGRCAVRQYVRRTGTVSSQQQAGQLKEQQQQQAQSDRRQRCHAQHAQTSACSSGPKTPAGGRSDPKHAGPTGGFFVKPAALGTTEARTRPATSDGEQAAGASETSASRSLSPLPCSANGTPAGTSSKALALLPSSQVRASSTNPASAYKTSVQASADICSASLPSGVACSNRSTASVAALSERCTRWKVLQLAVAATEQKKHVTGSWAGAEGVCVSPLPGCHGQAAPRPPDVLVACSDYLLRFLLPSVIFPPSHANVAAALVAAGETARGSAATNSSPAATDTLESPVVTGLGTSPDAGAAHCDPTCDRPRADAAASLPRSAPSDQEEQQQQAVASAAESAGSSCGILPGSAYHACSCLCHRYVNDRTERVLRATSLADDQEKLLCLSKRGMRHVQTTVTACPPSASVPDGSSAPADVAAVASADATCAGTSAAAVTGLLEGPASSAASSPAPPAAGAALDAAAAGNGVYSFFSDRLRAVRQEAVLQHLLHRPVYFLLLLQSTRYHLFADVFWGGGLFTSNAGTCTHSAATGTEIPPPLRRSSSSIPMEKAATPPERMQQQEKHLHGSQGSPKQLWHASDRAARHTEGAASVKNSAAVARDCRTGDAPETSSGKGTGGRVVSVSRTHTPAAAAAALLEKVGFSASLNRLLLASCMQQLLNFTLSTARRFSRRQQRRRQEQLLQGHVQGCTAGDATLAAKTSEKLHRSSVFNRGASRSKRAFSADFCRFASLLQVQPQDVDEIVACAVLYLLLPREDTAVPPQAVQLVLQQTASAFQNFWFECRWTQYAVRLVLLAAAGGAHRCLKELLVLPARKSEPFPFFLQCAIYSHLDCLRAAVAADIKAAAPLSSPGTGLSLLRLQQLLQCDAPAALRLAQATGATLEQEQVQLPEELQQPRDKSPGQEATFPVVSSLAFEATANVYFCRGRNRSPGESAQTRSTCLRQQQMRPHLRGGSVAAVSSQQREATRKFPTSTFAWLQSDAWRRSPPPDTFAFPRSRAEFRSLFDWPTHYTPP